MSETFFENWLSYSNVKTIRGIAFFSVELSQFLGSLKYTRPFNRVKLR